MPILTRVISALLLALPSFLFSAGADLGLRSDFHGAVKRLVAAGRGKSAAFVMDKGEHALLIRAWLAQAARQSLDVQYFIWSDDNVGRMAQAALVQAADRGVRCRILVDDLLLDSPKLMMLALDRHPRLDIKVYNPVLSTGVPAWKRWFNVFSDFRGVNQRMHHKAFLADSLVGITGGRNMADEYFDFDHEFNFRDRDVLAAGPVVAEMSRAFAAFWDAPLSRPLAGLLPAESAAMDDEAAQAMRSQLLKQALNPQNFAPDVRRGIENVPDRAPQLLRELDYCEASFLSDDPGKNDGAKGLGGGGLATAALAALLRSARKELLIQSPYAVLSPQAFALFRELRDRGVEITVSTNSAANSDNLQAVSGYQKQRRKLLAMGVRLFEHKPHPANMERLLGRLGKLQGPKPVFVMHAKTAVVDRSRLFIGTFNLDPRSENLNTEAGILMDSRKLAEEVALAIEEDCAPANSWDASKENGDSQAPFGRRLKLWFWRKLPLTPLL